MATGTARGHARRRRARGTPASRAARVARRVTGVARLTPAYFRRYAERRRGRCVMSRWFGLVLAAGLLFAPACQRSGFDWEQPENVLLEEKAETMPDGHVEMTFVSLVNVPPDDLFRAFSDVERHAEFIDGVTESRLVSQDGKKKVIDITNRVLGRPNKARIEWTIDEKDWKMSFDTQEAEFTDNSAEYLIEGSPDGKRSRVTSVYQLRDKGGHPFPLHSLKVGIRDGHVAAVQGVKRRALGPRAVVPRK
jgi:hypothetical protein